MLISMHYPPVMAFPINANSTVCSTCRASKLITEKTPKSTLMTLWEWNHADRWTPLTNGQSCGKRVHVMISSCQPCSATLKQLGYFFFKKVILFSCVVHDQYNISEWKWFNTIIILSTVWVLVVWLPLHQTISSHVDEYARMCFQLLSG